MQISETSVLVPGRYGGRLMMSAFAVRVGEFCSSSLLQPHKGLTYARLQGGRDKHGRLPGVQPP